MSSKVRRRVLRPANEEIRSYYGHTTRWRGPYVGGKGGWQCTCALHSYWWLCVAIRQHLCRDFFPPVLQLSGQMYSGHSIVYNSSRPSIPAEFSWCAHNTYPGESQLCSSQCIIIRKKVRTIRWAGYVDGHTQLQSEIYDT